MPLVRKTKNSSPKPAGMPCYLVAGPNGQIEFASENSQRWTQQTQFIDDLRGAVSSLEVGSSLELSTMLRSAEARISRLIGLGGVRYLFVLLPEPRRELQQLSPAQYTVALHAVKGATLKEIARSMNRSEETVRSHLREVYLRLGVASRLELARTLGSWGIP